MTTVWKLERAKEYPKLEGNIEADVVIIGGGLAGVWCAYLLSKEGKRVVLIEKDRLGQGKTEYTTAFITYVVDTSLSELTRIFGDTVAMSVWSSGMDAIDLIEEIVQKEKIECDFVRTPLYIYARSGREYDSLFQEHLLAEKFGFDTTLKKKAELGFEHQGVLEVPEQAKYHPIKFLQGLAEAAQKQGAKIFEETEAVEIVGNAPVATLTSDGSIITANSVVIATYDPFNNPAATRLKKGMYISYVCEFEISPNSLKSGLYLDMANPYHYVRVDERGGAWRMIVGGEDHRSVFKVPDEKNFDALRDYVRYTFPWLGSKEVRKWKGGILEPSDGLPLIGRVAPNKFTATAFSGNGMTYAAISGLIITDLILGRKNPYTKIYNPERHLLSKALLFKARDYAGEFFGGAVKNIFK